MHARATTQRGRAAALLLPFVVCLSLALVASGSTSAGAVATAPRTTATTTTAMAKHTVATTPQGTMTSRIVGSTANGSKVTGSFVPLHFVKKPGKVKVRGLVQGVVHRADGSTRTFAALRTLRVKSVDGTPATARTVSGKASCDVLHLVLAPLDLDLLGLKVHLDKVLLDVVAQSGAGNLLGNLLCAVTGLLDGGLGGQLGRLTNLLDQVLAALGLGL